MKAVFFGLVTAAVLAFGAAMLSEGWQIPASVAYATEGARVSPSAR